MSKMTIEISDHLITPQGIAAILEFYRTIAIDELQFPGLNVFATGVNSSSLNVVIDTRKDEAVSAETVNVIDSFFRKHKVPWDWCITATAIDEDIDIKKLGFNLLYQAPAMYLDLSNVLEIHTVNIKEANDDLHEWIGPVQEGFPSADKGEGYRKLNVALQRIDEKKLRHFTAYYNNEVAASATLFLSDAAVMLHNLATKHKFKNRGIGTLLTLHMMSEAKKAGYQHCFLDASEEGFNLYTRLGFKIYAMTNAYKLIMRYL